MIKRSLPGPGPSAAWADISVVGLGSFAMGGWMWGGQAEADSRTAIHAALAAGVTWIDTAPIYGSGQADAVIARVLRDLPPPERPLIFHKCGHHLVNGERVRDGSRTAIVADCEAQLRLFGVERLDLLQLHWPCPQPVAETAAAFAELLTAGKIARAGVSNFTVPQLEAWLAAGGPLHTVQNEYSLVVEEHATAVAPWCAENNVGFLAHSPLRRGLLSGTWTADKVFPPGDHRGERDEFKPPRLARYVAAVAELRVIADADELTVAELAVGALLCTEGVVGVIVGARNEAQGAALGSLGTVLRQNTLDAVAEVIARLRADLK